MNQPQQVVHAGGIGRRGAPSVHFRVSGGGLAHVLFLDGHVELWTDKTRNPPAPTDTQAEIALRDRENVYDIGATDALWDRE